LGGLESGTERRRLEGSSGKREMILKGKCGARDVPLTKKKVERKGRKSNNSKKGRKRRLKDGRKRGRKG